MVTVVFFVVELCQAGRLVIGNWRLGTICLSTAIEAVSLHYLRSVLGRLADSVVQRYLVVNNIVVGTNRGRIWLIYSIFDLSYLLSFEYFLNS